MLLLCCCGCGWLCGGTADHDGNGKYTGWLSISIQQLDIGNRNIKKLKPSVSIEKRFNVFCFNLISWR